MWMITMLLPDGYQLAGSSSYQGWTKYTLSNGIYTQDIVVNVKDTFIEWV